MLLYTNCCSISTWMSILTSYNCSYAWFPVIPNRRMSNICTKENNRFVKDLWSNGGNKD